MRKVFSALSVLLLTTGVAAAQSSTTRPAQENQTRTRQQVQATSNPALVSELSRALNATPPQAEGAAGALFAYARTRLAPPDWNTVAKAVPGMDGLLSAAPQEKGAMSSFKNAVGADTLADVDNAFQKLGLRAGLVPQAVPVLVSYVRKRGGAHAAQLLANALK